LQPPEEAASGRFGSRLGGPASVERPGKPCVGGRFRDDRTRKKTENSYFHFRNTCELSRLVLLRVRLSLSFVKRQNIRNVG
jgi:hypothetical protein